MDTINYCTLFNSSYLSRGLALYDSLCSVDDNFCLYIFAFDDKSKKVLQEFNLDKAVIIGLTEFEDDKLLKVKPTRTLGEYCWTCTPSVIKYAIEKYNLPSCTYLDADMFFYSSPKPVFKELADVSIGLTSHNYSSQYDKSIESGKYCVQFVYFKNSREGMRVLNWWRDECLKWCYAKVEDGKLGDQKYLESFSELSNEVHDITHSGAGIAPWNILNFSFHKANGQIVANNGSNNNVIFYHYQCLKIDYNTNMIYLGEWYDFSDDVISYFYIPYIRKLIHYENLINKTNYNFKEFRLIRANSFQLKYFQFRSKFSKFKLLRSIYNSITGK